jgi:hypothetical protein
LRGHLRPLTFLPTQQDGLFQQLEKAGQLSHGGPSQCSLAASRPLRPSAGSYQSLRQPSSIRIRRLPSAYSTPRPGSQPGMAPSAPPVAEHDFAEHDFAEPSGRRRSTSEPQRYGHNLAPPTNDLTRQRTAEMPTITEGRTAGMGTITEGRTTSGYPPPEASQEFYDAHDAQRPVTPGTPSINLSVDGAPVDRVETGASVITEAGNAARENRGLRRLRTAASRNERQNAYEYNSDVVDYLDLIGKSTVLPATRRPTANSA